MDRFNEKMQEIDERIRKEYGEEGVRKINFSKAKGFRYDRAFERIKNLHYFTSFIINNKSMPKMFAVMIKSYIVSYWIINLYSLMEDYKPDFKKLTHSNIINLKGYSINRYMKQQWRILKKIRKEFTQDEYDFLRYQRHNQCHMMLDSVFKDEDTYEKAVDIEKIILNKYESLQNFIDAKSRKIYPLLCELIGQEEPNGT